MKMALQGTTLRIKDADNVQFTVIKSWNKMRWVKKLQELQGTADLELLDRLAGLVRLPPNIEQLRSGLGAVPASNLDALQLRTETAHSRTVPPFGIAYASAAEKRT